MLARLHFVVRPMKGELIGDFDQADLERRLAEAARSWRDDFTAAVTAEYGEEKGSRLGRMYADSFPEAYKEDYPPRTGSVDLGRLEAIEGEEGLALRSTSGWTPWPARRGSRCSGSARRSR